MKKIYNILDYPDNGKHLECDIGIPCFQIRKGEDCFWFIDAKGEQKRYNNFKNKIDDRWIVELIDESNQSLNSIFKIKLSKNLDKIIDYCINIYKKSLKMELNRIKKELEKFD